MKSIQINGYLFLGIVALILVMGWWSFDRNEAVADFELRAKRELRDSQKAIELFQQEAENERKARKAVEAENLTLQRLNKKSDSTATYWQKQFTNEKKRKIRAYSDAGYDSLLNRIYPN